MSSMKLKQNYQTIFILRREPLYHKLQYSKTPKFDAAAATLGAGFGALSVYLGLAGFGSMGADLTDLTILGWYLLVWLCAIILQLSLFRLDSPLQTNSPVFFTFVLELVYSIVKEISSIKRRGKARQTTVL